MTTNMTNTAPTDDSHRPAGAGPVQRSVSGLVRERSVRGLLTPEMIAAEDAAGGVFAAGALMATRVAVLFAREDSHYKTLPGVEVYDMARDARNYDGPWPVVAHPPCRAWASLRNHAKPRPDERNLARLAVALVREFGGVLEHPHRTTLWDAQRLPAVGQRDAFGGFTLVIDQNWWGHRAQKRTRLYVVGCEPAGVPELPLVLGEATHTVGLWGGRDRATCRPSVSKHEYEHTPPELARWLVELAGRCKPANVALSGPAK